MKSEIVRNGNAVTRLTVSKDRITIKLAAKNDSLSVITFLEDIAANIQGDDSIRVTMRGALEANGIVMTDDLKAIRREFKF